MKPFLSQINRLLPPPCACRGVLATAATAADISGAGATFPYPIYAKWAEAYKAKTGIGLNYQSIGSGGGIAQIKAKTVTFGATDKPLSPGELDSAGLTQFPTVIGGVVPVVHLAGIKPGELVLDGKTLADIYLGKITKWNDAGDQEAEPDAESARSGDRGRAPLGRFGHELHLHELSLQEESRLGAPRWVPRRPWNGRPASARRAMKVLPATSPRPTAPSAMSNMPMPSRTT